jgi:hypothetical protein
MGQRWLVLAMIASGLTGLMTAGETPDFSLTVTPVEKTCCLGAPVGLRVIFRNNTPLSLGVQFDNPNGDLPFHYLVLRALDRPVALLETERETPGRFIVMPVKPDETAEWTVYLNRYCLFSSAGEYRFELEYHLSYWTMIPYNAEQPQFLILQANSLTIQCVTHPLTIVITERDEACLARHLDRALAESFAKDSFRSLAGTEAICWLNDPAAVPYLQRLLAKDATAGPAIRALARLNTPKTWEVLMMALVDGQSTDHIRENVLQSCGRECITIPRDYLIAMLASEDWFLILSTISYLLVMEEGDFTEYIRPFATDEAMTGLDYYIAEYLRRYDN